MLSVSVHKDIGEYTEKVVGKLSARTLACTAGGLAASVAAASFTYLVLGIQVSDAALPVMACSMPFWLLGFWKPKGMRAEEYLPLKLEHALSDGKLLYIPGFATGPGMADEVRCRKTDRKYRRRSKRKGAEAHEPSQEEQG